MGYFAFAHEIYSTVSVIAVGAGVSAVGMGSKLISKQLMADKDYAKIESETKAVLRIIHSIK